MTRKIETNKKIVLLFLSILPVFFPFGGRDTQLTQYLPQFIDVTDGTYLPWVLLICFIVFPLYWGFYGFLFSHWNIDFKTGIIWGNILIYFNVIGEMIYYLFLGYDGNQYPLPAFLLGSHIDKLNFSHIFGINSILLSIFASMSAFLLCFYLGYSFKKNRVKQIT